MKKYYAIITVIALLVLGSGLFYLMTKDTQDDIDTRASDTQKTEATQPDITGTTPNDQPRASEAVGTSKENSRRYITLSEYNSDKDAYSGNKKVFFFHASWCPICKAIEEDVRSDESQIPEGATFIEVDYDSNTSLRQKYGVTYQYTFVQIDNDGNEQKQWSALNLDKAIAGIQ